MDEGGRGLTIVAGLALDWGVEIHPEGTYQTVWADVSLKAGKGGGGPPVNG